MHKAERKLKLNNGKKSNNKINYNEKQKSVTSSTV